MKKLLIPAECHINDISNCIQDVVKDMQKDFASATYIGWSGAGTGMTTQASIKVWLNVTDNDYIKYHLFKMDLQ